MKIDNNNDEMQQIQWISDFLKFFIWHFFKSRFIESADGDPADKAALLCIQMAVSKFGITYRQITFPALE
jgi:hypothetical protein